MRRFANWLTFDALGRKKGEAFNSLLVRIAAVGAGFLLNLIIGRTMGAAGSGVYFIALACGTTIALLARLGQDILLVREIAAQYSLGNAASAKRLFHRSTAISLVAASVLAIANALLSDQIAEHIFGKPELSSPISIMGLLAIAATLLAVSAEAIRGAGRANQSQLLLLVAAPTLTIVILAVLPRPISVELACWAAVVGHFVAAMIATARVKRVLPKASSERLSAEFAVASQVRKGLPLAVTALVTYLSAWSDTLVLGALANPDVVGVYTVAARFAALCAVIKISVGSVVAPKLAAMQASGNMVGFRREALHYARLSAWLGLPLCLFIIVAAEPMLSLFGSEFPRGATTLRILVAGYAVTYLFGFGGIALSMSKFAHDLAFLTTVSLAVSFVLLLSLVPSFGTGGAAVAVASGTALASGFSWFVCRYRLKARIDCFAAIH